MIMKMEKSPESLLERVISLHGPEALREHLTSREFEVLQYSWKAWARPNQLEPDGDWVTWLLLAGRGYGKTRTAAEWIRDRVNSGDARRIALLGRTPGDVRDVMIGGELGVVNGGSGLIDIFPPYQRPEYQPTLRKLTFHTGAIAITYSSENPEQLRGPQHDTSWVDELGAFGDGEAWDNLQLGLRLGKPRQIVSTTPRPVRTIRGLVTDPDTIVTKGTTYENRSNLPRTFYSQIIRRYQGTRRGQQELEGLLLEDIPGALWQRAMIQYRKPINIQRVVIAVDPSISDGEDAAECGIVVGGIDDIGIGYILGDYSLRASPNEWAKKVVSIYHQMNATRIVAEENQGGKMVELTIRTVDQNVSYRGIYASVGKDARAEPVSALYEQGKVYHAEPMPDLEDQLCGWVPGEGKSPDRLDACVYALTELMISGSKQRWIIE